MIIDFHTHAFPDELAKRALAKLLTLSDSLFLPVTDATVGGLIAHMDKCGIDKSVLQPIVTKEKQLVPLNDWAVSMQSARIVSFGGIYPHSPDFKAAVDYVAGLGIKGLKLHPEYQHFVIDDPRMLPVYDYALSRGLILLFHVGFDPSFKPPFKSSAEQVSNVLDAMRGGTIVIAHMGGHKDWESSERHLCGRDVYFDTSMGFTYFSKAVFLRFVKNHGADRLLFGTDSPWSEPGAEIAALRAMPMTDGQKEQIFYGNASSLLFP
ncbi:MAG: amidohydrolase family protein [Clostridiales bacterium]|nr:amidohydrolase family protein [Clostridiales bacterium]